MPKISEVKVSYRRSVQPKQFESAEASVLLTLLFDEKEAPDVDEVIAGELDRVIRHVDGRVMNSKPAADLAKPAATSAKPSAKPSPATKPGPAKPAAKPAATTAKPAAPGKPPAPGKASKPAAPGKPGKPAAPGKPAKPAAPAPAAAEPEQGAIVFTKGDAMAAIGATMTRLAAAGKTDGADLIDKIILGYLPDDKPPFSYNRIPDDSLGDFISDLKKLEA